MKKSNQLSIEDFRNLLTPNTFNFLSKAFAERKQRLDTLNNISPAIKKNCPSLKKLKRELECLKSMLLKQIHIPKEQSKFVSLGSGVVLLIDGKKREFFVDSICIGPCKKIASLDSLLGSEIFNKEAGDSGNYRGEDGKIHRYSILEILPYSLAKQIFRIQKAQAVA